MSNYFVHGDNFSSSVVPSQSSFKSFFDAAAPTTSFSQKRQRPTETTLLFDNAFQPLYIISQEFEDNNNNNNNMDNDDDHNMYYSPPCKRQRRQQANDNNNETNDGHEMNFVTPNPSSVDSPNEDSTPNKLEPWWKRKSAATTNDDMTTDSDGAMCFICQSVIPEQHMEEEPEIDLVPPPSTKSLFAYFPRANNNNKSNKSHSAASVVTTCKLRPASNVCVNLSVPSCSYCERKACADCRVTCGICQERFCSFCSATDYSGRTARMLCLDCHYKSCETNNNNNDDNKNHQDDVMME